MSQKAQILLLFVIFIIILILAGGLVLIASITTTQNQTKPNIVDNNDLINELDPLSIIGGNKAADYKYAVINSDDTVTLFTEEGKRYDIYLDRANWSSIAWSPDSSIISVKGKRSSKSVVDLRYFFLADQKNSWITDYSIARQGVNQYFWADNLTLYFMQGVDSDKWLHRYYYPSVAEILKVLNTNSKIIDMRVAQTDEGESDYLLLIQNNSTGVFSTVDSSGETVWSSQSLIDEDENLVRPISVRFMIGNDKIIITAEKLGVEKYYKGLVQKDQRNNLASELTNVLNGTFIASVDGDEFISARFEGLEEQTLIFESIDSLKNISTKIAEYEIGSSKFNSLDVIYNQDGEIMFSLTSERNEKSWFSIVDKRITEIKFLSKSKEVKLAPRFGGSRFIISEN